MTSQPSTSTPAFYDHQEYVSEQMNMYPPMSYTPNLICSMQYFNNTHNRYQVPDPGYYNHYHPASQPHHPMVDDPYGAYSSTSYVPIPVVQPIPPSQPAGLAAGQLQLQQQQAQQQQQQNPTLTSAMDSCQQISHVLQCYQQGGEDVDFVRKAIESLVKKLKDKRIELDALITAVTSAGKQPTCCVTIQRSLDGRLQVAGRKGVPHVVYARIWRWPNVSKNELMRLVQCQTAMDHPDYICINPYHYERVVSNIINMDTSLHVDTPQHHQYQKKEYDYSESSGQEYMDWPNSPKYSNSQYQCSSSQQMSQHQSGYEDRNFDLSQIIIPNPTQPLDFWCSIIYYELDTQIGETFKVSILDHGKVVIDGGMDPHGENEGRFCLGALSNVHRTEASEKSRRHIASGVELTAHADGNVSLKTKCKIFVRSGYLDYCQGVEYGSKAHRVSPSMDNNWTESRIIFDIRWAFMQMIRRSESSNEAVRAQAAAVAGYAPLSVMPAVVPDSGVDRMRRDFCTIAISFVKGWGDMYTRKSIKETPCWIEVHLHRPLQLLDQLLKNNSQIGIGSGQSSCS